MKMPHNRSLYIAWKAYIFLYAISILPQVKFSHLQRWTYFMAKDPKIDLRATGNWIALGISIYVYCFWYSILIK